MSAPEVWTDEATGLQCAVLVGPLGNLNGYVAVPKEHPWHGCSYSANLCDCDSYCYEHSPESVIDVHGGLTYSGDGLHSLPANWWFGFDTAHAGDLVPQIGNLGGDVPRDFDFVKGEVERLAKQLDEVEL